MKWWTKSWNPMTGCTKCSPGCENCYAHEQAARCAAMGSKVYQEYGFTPTFHEDRLLAPFSWKKPEVVFVNSMSDVFHASFSVQQIAQVLNVILESPQHSFLICTKRIKRLTCSPWIMCYDWPDNLWLGVTVENQQAAYERIPTLLRTPACKRFVSVEPMLGPVNLGDFLCRTWIRGGLTMGSYLDWVIVGGENGKNSRPMETRWAEEILNQCQASGTPFFYKGAGGNDKKRELRGQRWEEMPEAIAAIFNERTKK